MRAATNLQATSTDAVYSPRGRPDASASLLVASAAGNCVQLRDIDPTRRGRQSADAGD